MVKALNALTPTSGDLTRNIMTVLHLLEENLYFLGCERLLSAVSGTMTVPVSLAGAVTGVQPTPTCNLMP